MAREGIAALLCAVVLFTPLTPHLAAEPERDGTIPTVLAVQQALRSGRENIAAGQYGAAVHVLEQQLSRINGNREYLACLRDAYRGHIKDLRQAGRADESMTYLRRLEILDPGARLDFPDTPNAAAPVAASPASQPAAAPVAASPAPQPAAAPASPPVPARLAADAPAPAVPPADAGNKGAVVRGQAEDPFHPTNSKENPVQGLLTGADKAYREKQYRTAGRLYEQAHAADPASVAGRHDEWAYCKLFAVKEQFAAADGPGLDRLEAEVKAAIVLSPKLQEAGKQYLATIQSRRLGTAAAVRHLEQRVAGWSVAESDYFRIFHKQDRESAEKVVQVAERTRREMDHKWFGKDTDWKLRCDLYLHPTAAEYSRATGKPASWTAHSSIKLEAGRVVQRKIDLRGDDPDLLSASLPHEATHAVLAGHFGLDLPPRWADEGMALLSEPPAKLDAYRRKLAEARRNRLLFSVRDLMTMEEYPEPARSFAFYCQSVSLTEFLVNQPGGPEAFVRFVNEALKKGYDSALQKTYNMDMATLEQRWRAATFDGESTQAAFRGASR
jgi:hypothetical protein